MRVGSFKEIKTKAENLTEQGNEAKQQVQTCQARVASCSSRVAAARRQLAAASETDENGNPRGDVAQARAELQVAEDLLEDSQSELAEAERHAERVRQAQTEHVRAMDSHTRAERGNLEKIRRLQSMAFGENAAELAQGIAERTNELEDARVELLRSMGIEATPEYVSAGGGSSRGGFGGFSGGRSGGSYGGSEGLPTGGVAAPVGGGLTDPVTGSASGQGTLHGGSPLGGNTERTSGQKTGNAADAPLSIQNYSSAFSKTDEERGVTQKLVDFVKACPNADKRVLNLYKSIGQIEQLEQKGIAFEIIHADKHYVGQDPINVLNEKGETIGQKTTRITLSVPPLSGDNITGQVQTTLHEQMHLVDLLLKPDVSATNEPSFCAANQTFMSALEKTSDSIGSDVRRLFAEHDKQCSELITEYRSQYEARVDAALKRLLNGGSHKAYREEIVAAKRETDAILDYRARNLMGGGVGQLEDIYDALSGGMHQTRGRVVFGHGADYYRSSSRRGMEIVANYASLSVTRPDLISMLRADKPELTAALDHLIDAMNERVKQ